MKYFSILPQMIVTDPKGNSKVFTNIMARTSIIPSLFQNPLLFYSYDIQDSDTPELIAHKYYGYIERFWMVLFANQILDPQWDWPLNTNDFNAYITNKYPSTDPYNTVKEYQKIITQYDSTTQETTIVPTGFQYSMKGTVTSGTSAPQWGQTIEFSNFYT